MRKLLPAMSRSSRLKGFMEHAVSENVYAGTAMQRRATYMYGLPLPRDEKGLVDNGLGKYPSVGRASLIAPTIDINRTGQILDY